MTRPEILGIVRAAVGVELKGLTKLRRNIPPAVADAVRMIASCKGRIVFTGVGKSGLIGRKVSATFSSIGVSSFFFNPSEGVHGDLGALAKNDVVVAFSKSGNTQELLKIIPFIRRVGLGLISVTENSRSRLSRLSDISLVLPDAKEACPYNLAPTTSTTMQLVLGDAMAIALLKEKKFTAEDFALLHPGGNLGRQMMKVAEIMRKGRELPLVPEETTMEQVLGTIISKKLGVAIITGKGGRLAGIIVDGDLKRILLKNRSTDLFKLRAKDVMTRSPATIGPDKLVVEALSMMQGRITSLVVAEGGSRRPGKPVGLVHVHDILRQGFA